MKIGVIHSIYKPDVRGGAEVAVDNIALGLKNQGDDVFVICVGRKNILSVIASQPTSAGAVNQSHGFQEDIPKITHEIALSSQQIETPRNDNNIRVYRIKSFNLFNFLDINSQPVFLRFFWHLLDMCNEVQTWRAYRILSREKPDIVFTHNLKGLGYHLPWLLKIMKIKNVQTIHDMQLIHPSGLLAESGKIGFLAGFYAGLNKILFKPVRSVVFPSDYIKSVYDQHGFFTKAEKIVLGNPILKMPTLPEGGQAATPSGADWGGGRGEFQILFLGQVEAYKGIFDLLEAVRGIKNNFVLNIVGDGSAMAEAKIRAQKATADSAFGAQIRFWGRLEQKELKDKIWPITDILINPSRVPESFGLVVAEALAHGVPVIATNIGALPELVEGDWLFEAGNISDLRAKIELLANEPSAYEKSLIRIREKIKSFEVNNYLNRLKRFAKL